MFKEVKSVKGRRGSNNESDAFIRVDLRRCYFSLSKGLTDSLLIYEGLYCGVLSENEKENNHDVFKFAIYFSNNKKNCRKVYRNSNVSTDFDFRVKNTSFAREVSNLFPKNQVSVKFFIRKSIYFYQTLGTEKVKIYPLFVDRAFLENEYPEYLELFNAYEEEIIKAYGKKQVSQ